MEKIYLNFEIAKCHTQIGIDNFKKARIKATDGLKLAVEISNYTWAISSLILLGSIEFQLNQKVHCSTSFNKAIFIAQKLQEPGVITFLKKVNYEYII